MVLIIITTFIMLKRRLSKRFVLAESGEESTWDPSLDNNQSPEIIPIGDKRLEFPKQQQQQGSSTSSSASSSQLVVEDSGIK